MSQLLRVGALVAAGYVVFQVLASATRTEAQILPIDEGASVAHDLSPGEATPEERAEAARITAPSGTAARETGAESPFGVGRSARTGTTQTERRAFLSSPDTDGFDPDRDPDRDMVAFL